jgi:hypothetical protein
MSVGHDSNDSGFGDFSDSGGFGGDDYYDEDDDILRNADDAAHLDFHLDPAPSHHRKRTAKDDATGDFSKRTRFSSADSDDIQRIAREDHDYAREFRQIGFSENTGEFGDAGFVEYRTPPIGDNVERVQDTVVAREKKRRRIVIVEDDSSIIDSDEYRSWPQKYLATQAAASARRRTLEMTKLAKEHAQNYLWGWNGRKNSSLPPALSQLFSRTALLKLWVEPSNATEKRKRDDNERLELAMGNVGGFGVVGGGGGFDSIDYSVRSLFEIKLMT